MINERMLSATYRLQLHAGFGFADVERIAPYLHRLGVSHVYSSPILTARPGSNHGYDVVDPRSANPELGGEQARLTMIDALHSNDLGLILDIVPNHMGTGPHNPFWIDVLSHGQASAFAKWFDVGWAAPSRTAPGRIQLPVLGDELDAVLSRGELSLAWTPEGMRAVYFDDWFPTDPATIPRVLGAPPGKRGQRMAGEDYGALGEILVALERLPSRTGKGGSAPGERRRIADAELRRLRELAERVPAVREHIERRVEQWTTGSGAAERMRELLDAQPYRLTFWRDAPRDLNYRRFFDINDLVALRMEDPEVFAETHERIFQWIADGSLDGIRIDHIDGLLHPAGYLRRLRAAIGARGRNDESAPFPIFVEKILSPGERLRRSWPVQGTTGYEFLNDLEAVFIDPVGHAAITAFYARLAGLPPFAEVAWEGKRRILESSLSTDVTRLSRLLVPLAATGRRTSGLGRGELRRTLIELLACLPVYRTYVDPVTGEHEPEDRAIAERMARRATERRRVPVEGIELVRRTMVDPAADPPGGKRGGTSGVREHALRFIAGFQQTSGPATAKGVEDTALYQHVALASLNEVGSEPDRPLEAAVALLHDANAERARDWPVSLLCTSTHDTKRSADVRSRLDVLSEIPDRWEQAVLRWRRINRVHRRRVRDRMAPDANTEYLLYQTLVGVWPFGTGNGGNDADALGELRERVTEYMLKAAREAKLRTSWTDGDEAFEAALSGFIEAIFAGGPSGEFLREVGELAGEIARPGLWNALARTLLHLTAPGTPDVYQGDELWNFSLVDPDNRRPVDYELRDRLLGELEQGRRGGAATWGELARDMMATPEDGRIKLWTTWRALHCRRSRPKLFLGGRYEPLEVRGPREKHLFAFARSSGTEAAIMVVTRLPYGTTGALAPPAGAAVWAGTRVRLPSRLGVGRWQCQLGGHTVEMTHDDQSACFDAGALLSTLPVALLVEA